MTEYAPEQAPAPIIPASVRMPEDHKPAAQAEAEGEETVTIDHGGKKYTLPATPDDWPVKVSREFEAERPINASSLLLERAGYDVEEMTNRTLGAIFEAYGKAAGFAEGES